MVHDGSSKLLSHSAMCNNMPYLDTETSALLRNCSVVAHCSFRVDSLSNLHYVVMGQFCMSTLWKKTGEHIIWEVLRWQLQCGCTKQCWQIIQGLGFFWTSSLFFLSKQVSSPCYASLITLCCLSLLKGRLKQWWSTLSAKLCSRDLSKKIVTEYEKCGLSQQCALSKNQVFLPIW